MILWLEAQAFVHQIKEAVKANAGPPEGVYVQSPHSHILRVSNMGMSSAPDIRRRPHRDLWLPAESDLGEGRYFSRGPNRPPEKILLCAGRRFEGLAENAKFFRLGTEWRSFETRGCQTAL
jgi:hypothetical protein